MEEFQALASRLNWLEEVLVGHFKGRLNDDMYYVCIPRGDPDRLHDWYNLAEEAEIDQAWRQRHLGRSWGQSPVEEAWEPPKQTPTTPRSSGCFKCRKEGHRVAGCLSDPSAET